MKFNLTVVSFSLITSLLMVKSEISSGLHAVEGNINRCPSAPAGIPGIPGTSGRAGRDGRDGIKGERGTDGIKGGRGEKGERGTDGAPFVPNIKQCAWDNISDRRNNAIIKDCIFNKTSSRTALRVLWNGNFRARSQAYSCTRWYFTFDGQECRDPLPIDTVLFTHTNFNMHFGSSVEGLCYGIPAGRVDVEFRVGSCRFHPVSTDLYTGWASVSRMVIEELPSQLT
ncbi:collagen triple helix repeat-containing protein 1-like [Glandiceps talaboti]